MTTRSPIVKGMLKHLPQNCRNWSFLFLVLLIVSLVPAFVGAILQQNWSSAFLAGTAIVFIYTPFVIQAKARVYIPRIFSFALALFVYATLFLGEVEQYYDKYPWWDAMLHAGSAFAFGLLGLILILIFLSKKKIQTSPILTSVLIFSFALSLGALWEIFEFANDQIRGTNMQRSGLVDTMWDLIIDTIGGAVAAIVGYFYLTPHTPKTLFDPIIERIVRRNR